MKMKHNNIFSFHLAFPLVALLPVHLHLHRLEIANKFIKDVHAPAPATEKALEIIARVKPDSLITHKPDEFDDALREFVNNCEEYRHLCVLDYWKQTDRLDVFDNSYQFDEKWDEPYCATFFQELRKNPSASEIINHQRVWLYLLLNPSPEFNYLSTVIRRGLRRLLVVRDTGRQETGFELSDMELSNIKPDLTDQRIARYIDFVMELIEEVCVALEAGVPYSTLQNMIDRAQREARTGFTIIDAVDDPYRLKTFLPLLANIIAFTEGFDATLHRLQAWTPKNRNGDEETDLLEIINLLIDLPQTKNDSDSMIELYRGLIQKYPLLFKVSRDNPRFFFSGQFWELSVLGPRVLARLLLVSANKAIDEYEFKRATAVIRRIRLDRLEPKDESFPRRYFYSLCRYKLSLTHRLCASWGGILLGMLPAIILLVYGVIMTKESLEKIDIAAVLAPALILQAMLLFPLLPIPPKNSYLPRKSLGRVYRNLVVPPHTLQLGFGAIILYVHELDYDLWKNTLSNFIYNGNSIIYFSPERLFSIFLFLAIGCIHGAYLILPEKNDRWQRSLILLSQLFWWAMYPALFIWWIGHEQYNYSPLALLFLALASIFFALFISNIAELTRKIR